MIYLGADHGGFELKEKIKSWLSEWNFEYEDCGALTLDPGDDYTDFAHEVALKVIQAPEQNKGVLLCRSGGGMVIAANRHLQSRAVFVSDERSAIHARKDNNANIISFAADWIDESTAKQSLFVFLQTPFSAKDRHVRRIRKIDQL